MTKYDEEVVGEHKEKAAKKVFTLGDIRLYECPLSYITNDTREMLRAVYMADSLGVLLLGKGLGEEPCWFVEAFEAYGREASKSLKER